MNIGDLPERIAIRVAPDVETGCWNWTGSVAPNGYGVVAWRKDDGQWRSTPIHRVTYHLLADPRLVVHCGRHGTELDHLCRNKRCCNPVHLEPVDRATNARRMRIATNYRSAVLALIEKHGPMTSSELRERGVPSAHSRCSHLRSEGRLTVVGTVPVRGAKTMNVYALTERGRQR